MQFFFESFNNKPEIKTTTVDFNIFELRQFYIITPKETFISFMDYMTLQIVKYNLKLDLDDFVIDCYTATDEGLFYNPYFFDRFQEPEYTLYSNLRKFELKKVHIHIETDILCKISTIYTHISLYSITWRGQKLYVTQMT